MVTIQRMSLSKLSILQDQLVTKLLLILDGSSCSTVQLLEQLKTSFRDGRTAIRRAEQLGLIKTAKGEHEVKRGRKPIINTLTPRGRKLAKLAKQLSN